MATRRPFKPALLLAQGEGVEQGLGGMLVGAVARVDDGGAAVPGQEVRRPRGLVPDHDHVGVHGLEVLGGVEEGLALGRRSRWRWRSRGCPRTSTFCAISNDDRVRVLAS